MSSGALVEVLFFGWGKVPGGGLTCCGGSVGCGMWSIRSPFLVSLAVFGVRLLAFRRLVFLRGVVFLEEFVPVLAEVSSVDDLVEVLSGFFFLLIRVRVGPVVSEVVRGAVGGLDRECRPEQLFFGREVRRESPHV